MVLFTTLLHSVLGRRSSLQSCKGFFHFCYNKKLFSLTTMPPRSTRTKKVTNADEEKSEIKLNTKMNQVDIGTEEGIEVKSFLKKGAKLIKKKSNIPESEKENKTDVVEKKAENSIKEKKIRKRVKKDIENTENESTKNNEKPEQENFVNDNVNEDKISEQKEINDKNDKEPKVKITKKQKSTKKLTLIEENVSDKNDDNIKCSSQHDEKKKEKNQSVQTKDIKKKQSVLDTETDKALPKKVSSTTDKSSAKNKTTKPKKRGGTDVNLEKSAPPEGVTDNKKRKMGNAPPKTEEEAQTELQEEIKEPAELKSGRKKPISKKESSSTSGSEPKLTQAGRGKRGAPKKTAEEGSGESNGNSAEPPNKKAKSEKKPPMNKSATNYESIDFSNSSKTSQGQPWNLKISSWNVDGIRAWLNKGGLDYIKYEKPDILCLQEVKCASEKLPKELTEIPGYHPYWLCSDQDGYAGVGLYTTKMPINVQYGIKDEELDTEGRIITAEYEQFYLISTYVPNAGRKLVTLPKKLKWNEVFHRYVKELDAKKPVIICGDMNVAHKEIDLSNPKSNTKNAGFTKEERDGMTTLLNDGFVDTYRHLYPDKTGAYTFWTYMMNSRARNVGWRLDYMIVSERLVPAVCDSVIRSEVYGSDHCPITLFLHLTSLPNLPAEQK